MPHVHQDFSPRIQGEEGLSSDTLWDLQLKTGIWGATGFTSVIHFGILSA